MRLKERLNEAISNAATSFGYDVIPHWRREAQPLSRHLRHLFATHRIDCVLDVGGNMGQYHDFIRSEVGFEGPIFSFEPVAKYTAILNEKAKGDTRWFILGHALGREKSTAEINVTTSPGLNSFLDARTDAVPTFWDNQESVPETVKIETLDDTWAALQNRVGFHRPYLKLDTQGFDLEVVRGASKVLKHVVALQTEASVKPIYHAMPTYIETIENLAGHGFHLSGMFPVTLDESLRLVEFDCVMVR